MTADSWSLRLAHIDDADYLPAIERAAGQLLAGEPDLAAIDFNDVLSAKEQRGFIAKGHCLVACAGEDIVGFLASQPFGRELHIWEMSVLPAFQQRGIGAGLLRACIIDAKNSGFAAVTLTTFRDIAWNAPFYEKIGFATISDLAAHPRLAKKIAHEASQGLPRDRRCAMICFTG
ncbi:GNAT family N-acetyltransferase [Pontixanthobacter sp.]|uniref:GNAT family N-acetyltransferase n=1 Tax=Pontixanthobacter sp. TaxID=2792078 RepID=UPI003C7AE665